LWAIWAVMAPRRAAHLQHRRARLDLRRRQQHLGEALPEERVDLLVVEPRGPVLLLAPHRRRREGGARGQRFLG
jgi:hypothetical protein